MRGHIAAGGDHSSLVYMRQLVTIQHMTVAGERPNASTATGGLLFARNVHFLGHAYWYWSFSLVIHSSWNGCADVCRGRRALACAAGKITNCSSLVMVGCRVCRRLVVGRARVCKRHAHMRGHVMQGMPHPFSTEPPFVSEPRSSSCNHQSSP